MSFIKLPYDNAKLDAIRIRIENHARVNDPIYYAVVIDDLEVIPRTSDATLFTTIDELIGPTTKYISISEYIGHTRNRKTTCFVMDVPKSADGSSLHGIETNRVDQQQSIEEKVEHATLKRDYSTLQTENNKLKHVNEVLLERNDKLEEENKELRRLHDADSQQTTFLSFATDILDRFAPNKGEAPLSGTPEQDVRQAEEGDKSDSPVDVAVPEQEYKNYQHFTEMFKNFDQVQRGLVTRLIELLSEHPDLIEETYMETHYKSQDNGNEEDGN
jgi:hypothetical protein